MAPDPNGTFTFKLTKEIMKVEAKLSQNPINGEADIKIIYKIKKISSIWRVILKHKTNNFLP